MASWSASRGPHSARARRSAANSRGAALVCQVPRSRRSHPAVPLLICALFAVPSGCGGGSSAPVQQLTQPPPDFSVSFTPSTVSLSQGGTRSPVTVTATSLNNFSGAIQITLGGLPVGVTSNPASPFTVSSGSSTTLLFGAASTAATGSVAISAQAVGGSLSHTASLTLTVQSATVSILPRTTFAPTDSIPSVDDPVGEPHHRHLVYDPANQRI